MFVKTHVLLLGICLLLGVGCQHEGQIVSLPTMEFTATRPALQLTPTPFENSRFLVEIKYTGDWYRKTFNYESDAPNIRHLVYVVPEGREDSMPGPGLAFSVLQFKPYPEPLAVRQDMPPVDTDLLEYMYDAPGGLAEIDLHPGNYLVAVAFIAAPLPPPDEDAILYPGVTGGGASTEYRQMMLRAGEEKSIQFILTDQNGWGYVDEMAYK